MIILSIFFKICKKYEKEENIKELKEYTLYLTVFFCITAPFALVCAYKLTIIQPEFENVMVFWITMSLIWISMAFNAIIDGIPKNPRMVNIYLNKQQNFWGDNVINNARVIRETKDEIEIEIPNGKCSKNFIIKKDAIEAIENLK